MVLVLSLSYPRGVSSLHTRGRRMQTYESASPTFFTRILAPCNLLFLHEACDRDAVGLGLKSVRRLLPAARRLAVRSITHSLPGKLHCGEQAEIFEVRVR